MLNFDNNPTKQLCLDICPDYYYRFGETKNVR